MRELGCLGLMLLAFPVAMVVWWTLRFAAAEGSSLSLLFLLIFGIPAVVFIWTSIVDTRFEPREQDEMPDSSLY